MCVGTNWMRFRGCKLVGWSSRAGYVWCVGWSLSTCRTCRWMQFAGCEYFLSSCIHVSVYPRLPVPVSSCLRLPVSPYLRLDVFISPCLYVIVSHCFRLCISVTVLHRCLIVSMSPYPRLPVSMYPYPCLPVSIPPILKSPSLSVFISTCLDVFMYLSRCLHASLSRCLHVCLDVFISICLDVFMSRCLSYLPVLMSLYLSVSVPPSLVSLSPCLDLTFRKLVTGCRGCRCNEGTVVVVVVVVMRAQSLS